MASEVEQRCEHGFANCAICESAPWAIKIRRERNKKLVNEAVRTQLAIVRESKAQQAEHERLRSAVVSAAQKWYADERGKERDTLR